jgi:hypothetical protein
MKNDQVSLERLAEALEMVDDLKRMDQKILDARLKNLDALAEYQKRKRRRECIARNCFGYITSFGLILGVLVACFGDENSGLANRLAQLAIALVISGMGIGVLLAMLNDRFDQRQREKFSKCSMGWRVYIPDKQLP